MYANLSFHAWTVSIVISITLLAGFQRTLGRDVFTVLSDLSSYLIKLSPSLATDLGVLLCTRKMPEIDGWEKQDIAGILSFFFELLA